jgi:hypothetical protein
MLPALLKNLKTGLQLESRDLWVYYCNTRLITTSIRSTFEDFMETDGMSASLSVSRPKEKKRLLRNRIRKRELLSCWRGSGSGTPSSLRWCTTKRPWTTIPLQSWNSIFHHDRWSCTVSSYREVVPTKIWANPVVARTDNDYTAFNTHSTNVRG